MPGSQTSQSPVDACDFASTDVAFRNENCVGTLISEHFAAQWLAYMCPCQRFACSLATARA